MRSPYDLRRPTQKELEEARIRVILRKVLNERVESNSGSNRNLPAS